ncbi:exosortase/archaeosortase family protein [Desulfosediminicola ganghwensis]|uniref:exosortase/archaeosortase family protein n=1 Tax=Desulfosediminicola ganghwensis TaxID=2569540 RepID=UPI0010ACDC96|nr:exosortase/archaeosortase family protein [Desulfosediminicola ganghwensis]
MYNMELTSFMELIEVMKLIELMELKTTRFKRSPFGHILGLTIVCLLIIFLYKITLLWMYDRYTAADSYYSHGFLVPLISLYFIYQKRQQLQLYTQQFSMLGLLLILFALLLHILGTVLYIFSISGFSIFFLTIGLSLFLFGNQRTKVIWFPLLFLIFMFPLPMTVISFIAFPLKMMAAKAGVWVTSLLGVPVYHEGFNIYIPAGHLLVDNPCSGLRSLISFMALGSIFAYVAPIPTGRKWLLFLLTIPIALFSNFTRVPLLVQASHYLGLEAAAPDTIIHTGTGILVFVIGFVLLLTSAKVLE